MPKLLVISEIGCGPPFHGNRSRLRTLLIELRKMNFVIHFAGVDMSAEEKNATFPFVDRWVWDFKPTLRSTFWSRLRGRKSCKHYWNLNNDGPESVDRWIEPEWMEQCSCLQQSGNYDAVLVEYVFHSAFLECFDRKCLRVLDSIDIFADRNLRLYSHGVTDGWFSTTIDGEKCGLARADRILAIQRQEADYFRGLLGEYPQIFTVGHIVGIDILPWPSSQRLVLGYLGSENPINVKSMEWLISNVWEPFGKELDGVDLLVGGGICRYFVNSAAIQTLGEVSSVRDFYNRVHLTINPMIVGTGLKIKTIESMAYGRASIGTSVACEGIEEFVGRGIYLANKEDEFVMQISRLADDKQEVCRSGLAAAASLEELNEVWKTNLRAAFNI